MSRSRAWASMDESWLQSHEDSSESLNSSTQQPLRKRGRPKADVKVRFSTIHIHHDVFEQCN